MHRLIRLRRYCSLCLLLAASLSIPGRAAAQGNEGLPGEAPGMFGGGLFSSLFTGAPFTGPRLADIVILGLGVFMLFRFLTNRRPPATGPDKTARPAPAPGETARAAQSPAQGANNVPDSLDGQTGTQSSQTPPPPGPGGPVGQGGPVGPDGREPSLARAYQAAEAAWGGLRSTPKSPEQAPGAQKPAFASQDEEFLAGAKAVYARIREAMEKGDVSGMTAFVAPDFMAELARMATERTAQTGGKTSQLFLIEAAITGRESQGGVTRIETRYEAVGALPGASGDDRTREIWTFERDETSPGSMWRLRGIRAA